MRRTATGESQVSEALTRAAVVRVSLTIFAFKDTKNDIILYIITVCKIARAQPRVERDDKTISFSYIHAYVYP